MSHNDFAKRLGWFLDNSIRLPGGYRIGVDGLLGLIPGLGDAIAGLLSGLILFQAHRAGIPTPIKLRMLINILIDTSIGAIPVFGDIFDFVWKANQRNADLITAYQQHPDKVKRHSLVGSLLFLIILIIALVLMIWLAIWIASNLWSLLITSVT
ncbi:hypothetical protein Q7C_1135 [Methylophaga frappieri]|uniref:DUF4112 domain-containing protein n=1 Tax=Methylophaga frappieri (strain ATCC BAA-2434 / DSM 25690 / JAM7) TaxID=754477 RepID=I1YH97_METFJ|nr:DUF4112 domain-containing protein [Methylophaga frappieri]AFJ02290.1 hypothetical protein Q7C_1135 [Methylophaga frappieri]